MSQNNRSKRLKEERTGMCKLNNQGCLMKIIQYNNACDMLIEFQDNYHAQKHVAWKEYELGNIKNPYFPEVCGVGIVGNKYPSNKNGRDIKEYTTWSAMIHRCYDEEFKNNNPAYQDVTCCEEWLLFENFYEWLHSQENFNAYISNKSFQLDKDIKYKWNKIYSPETCFIVPKRINCLFLRNKKTRTDLPIGVHYKKKLDKYIAAMGIGNGENKHIGVYSCPEEAFYYYKIEKEKYIKQLAEQEYALHNISIECYNAMMNYQVEITD